MERADEPRALAQIQDRLQLRFPWLAGEVVEAAVRLARSESLGLVGAFAPVLVEYVARQRLSFALPPEATSKKPTP